MPLADWFHELGLEASAHATTACAKSLHEEDLRGEVSNIQVPTLLLHGKNDETCDYAFSEVLHEKIPNSTLVPFEKSGHGLINDEKEKFNQQLLDLLK